MSIVGGTILSDDSAKWELCKIDESVLSKDSELLQGKTVEQIKSETLANVPAKTNVTVVVGVVNFPVHSRTATIPLPSGYVRSQCRYFINTVRFSYDNDSSNAYSWAYSSMINRGNGVVSLSKSPDDYGGINIPYLCIAVK